MTTHLTAPEKTRRKIFGFAGAGLVLVALGVVGFFLAHRSAIARASLPPRPALRGWSREFSERLEEAESDTTGYLHGVRGLVALSRLYHINGFYNQALSCYDGLRALQPGEPKWCHLEATILADFGRSEDAIPLYRRAIALKPDDDAGRIKLGEILLRSNRPAEALDVFKAALQENPHNVYAELGLAQIATARGDWSSAKASLEMALREQPDFVGGLSLLVTVEEKVGDAAVARALHETLGSQEFVDIADPWVFDLYRDCYDPYRLSVAATVQRFAKNYPASIDFFERAIQLAPNASSYQRELGLLFADMERYDEAKPHALKATELAPNDPYTWTLLVRVLTGLRENDAAWQALYQGLEHCPNSQDLHMARGNRLLQNERYAEAVAEFKETHRLWPSEAAPLVDLAQTQFRMGQNEEALHALKEALELQPGNPAALSILAVYSIQIGDKAAAASYYHQLEQHAGTVGPVAESLRQSYQSKFGETLP